MTAFVKRDAYQDNLIDGSVYMYDVRHDGIYVTVAGNNPDDMPIIIAFDNEDISALRSAIGTYDRGGIE